MSDEPIIPTTVMNIALLIEHGCEEGLAKRVVERYELACRGRDATTRALEEANALATKWMRRFTEATEPGSAGAFARRDHEIELRKAAEATISRLTAERDSVMALNSQMLAAQERLTIERDGLRKALANVVAKHGGLLVSPEMKEAAALATPAVTDADQGGNL